MSLVAQWDALVAALPAGWSEVGVQLRTARPEDARRAAALLGSLSPGIVGNELYLRATSEWEAGPGVVRRLLARLDAEGINGTLEPAEDGAHRVATEEVAQPPTTSLAASWDELVASLPDDWTDLLCLVELRSSDDLAPAALALAPLNPSRDERKLAFRFRVARRFGYGAAPGMGRRSLERLDEQGTPGRLQLLEALSDTRPVLTQGPTFVVSDRAV